MVVEAVEVSADRPDGASRHPRPLATTRLRNTTGRWKIIGQEAGEDEGPSVGFGQGDETGAFDECREFGVGDGARPMANAGTSTLRTGPSRSAGKRSSSVPIRNDPAGISTASEPGADVNEPSVGDGRFVVGNWLAWGEQQGELTRPS